jgi:hypothetical protein
MCTINGMTFRAPPCISTQTHTSARSRSVLLSDTAIKIPSPRVFSALTLSAPKTRKETVVETRVVKPDFGQQITWSWMNWHLQVIQKPLFQRHGYVGSKCQSVFASLKLAKLRSHAREMWSFIRRVKCFLLQSLQYRCKIIFLMHSY